MSTRKFEMTHVDLHYILPNSAVPPEQRWNSMHQKKKKERKKEIDFMGEKKPLLLSSSQNKKSTAD